MKQITMEEYLAKFDPTIRAKIEKQAGAAGVTHLVLFENLQMDSWDFGERSSLCVGPNFTYETLGAIEGKWLKDLPSQRQYPVEYVTIGESE